MESGCRACDSECTDQEFGVEGFRNWGSEILPDPTDTQLRNHAGPGFFRSVFAFRVHDLRIEGSGFMTLRNRVQSVWGQGCRISGRTASDSRTRGFGDCGLQGLGSCSSGSEFLEIEVFGSRHQHSATGDDRIRGFVNSF